jgi:hypothetical protein
MSIISGVDRMKSSEIVLILFFIFLLQGTIWFNIGSVEAFERNLENAQLEMNVEPANFVSVVYKSETEV